MAAAGGDRDSDGVAGGLSLVSPPLRGRPYAPPGKCAAPAAAPARGIFGPRRPSHQQNIAPSQLPATWAIVSSGRVGPVSYSLACPDGALRPVPASPEAGCQGESSARRATSGPVRRVIDGPAQVHSLRKALYFLPSTKGANCRGWGAVLATRCRQDLHPSARARACTRHQLRGYACTGSNYSEHCAGAFLVWLVLKPGRTGQLSGNFRVC